MEKEVEIINSIIKEAIFYGRNENSILADEETLFEAINNWLELKNLNEKYEIAVDIFDEHSTYQLFGVYKIDDVRQDMIDKWKKIYHNNNVCMVHLLASEEAKELTQGEKQGLLIHAGEFDPRDSMAMAVLDK